ncbi:N utilization substance protein B [Sporomusaceae bacterium BoRhaA]|uniref:transcription antitermination factor NusB n=1 Tax=Pelorhabdus rhamnosifermentans TaxID=2772457 RepID=UPI001C064855|nr:transcription antitermination factor NusB [Pelorhabdus rhamnosifermentans]MBU2700940.1 N utilization substance protein B [Pelorhabdus rhamnosifermentans]
MSRRIARELALQALFQLDFNEITPEEALINVCNERKNVSAQSMDYARILLVGTLDKKTVIDEVITTLSKDWKIDRMPGVDRNIVRMALFEMDYGTEELSPGVIINEAVELAKAFATEESSKFVNGILGSLVKQRAK